MKASPEAIPDFDRRIVTLSLLATLLSAGVAIFAAIGLTAEPGAFVSAIYQSVGIGEFGWIVAQAFWLTLPGVAFACLLQRFNRRAVTACGAVLVLVLPALMLADAITFHWIGERFLSSAMLRVATELRPGLLGHVTLTMFVGGLGLLLFVAAISAATWWSATRVARKWAASPSLPRPMGVLVGAGSISLVIALPSLVDFEQTRRAMAEHSSRHPLCVIGIFSAHGPGAVAAVQGTVTRTSPLEQAVLIRDHQQRRLGVDRVSIGNRSLPDVLIVVVESFRHELVDPAVMPQLSQYAERGLHCRFHFSGGNATNHGMFSLLNGLEAIWYERPVRYSPLLPRLFRQAGYELGFFAGHDDWRKFYMDGYLSPEHFDVFETSAPDGLASDRRATRLASGFLSHRSTPDSQRPRLALLYLYATHATYHSYLEDQIFTPAADQRMLMPYPQSSQPKVWNRYKNSARTVDRFLSAVMSEDRVVLVTGDHGESFLEDDTIGHGIRVSAFQNMTPAVLYVPGKPHRVIEAPTSHADLLPTLLSAIGIPIREKGVFDGVDLFKASDDQLSQRLLVTRNYLRDDIALIGPWTRRDDRPFAYRLSVSLREMRCSPLSAIDRRGYEQSTEENGEATEVLEQWIESRFRCYLKGEGRSSESKQR